MTTPVGPTPRERAGAASHRRSTPTVVEELLRLFGKAARAHQLYLPNNPIYKSAHDALRAGFAPVWEETDELVLGFTESEVKWEGQTVLAEASRGQRQPSVAVLQGRRARAAPAAGLRGRGAGQAARHHAARAQGVARRGRPAHAALGGRLRLPALPLRRRLARGQRRRSPTAETIASDERARIRASRRGGERRARRASSTWPTSTARSTSSTSGRSSTCRRRCDREYRADLRQNVIAILLDIFEQQSAAQVRGEVAELLDVLMVHMLSAGQFQNVAYLHARVAGRGRARRGAAAGASASGSRRSRRD